MTLIKNAIANFVGKFWSLFSVFIFLPLYIEILGFENYSIISFTIVIAGMIIFLDSGLTATLGRELARVDIGEEKKKVTVKTLESLYLIIIGVITGGLFFGSNYIASNLINQEVYQSKEMTFFIRLIAFEISFQMLFRFYIGGLIGIEKQVLSNMIQVGWGILRNGAVVLVILISPSLKVFFVWQLAISILFALFAKIVLHRNVHLAKQDFLSFRIDRETVKTVWKFAGGIMLISAVAAINTQLDKLTISTLLSVEELGFYTLGVSLATMLITIVSPISTAILPRLTALYTGGRHLDAQNLFRNVQKISNIIVFSIAAGLFFFSAELIWIWTGDQSLAEEVAKILPVLAFSFSMLAIAIIPFSIVIANGYTKLNNILGVLSLILTIPGYWIFVKSHGPIGAAYVFMIVQIIVTCIYLYFVNRLFLKISFWELYLKNTVFPLIIVSTVFALFSLSPWMSDSRILSLFIIGIYVLVAIAISVILLFNQRNLLSVINLIKSRKIAE